MREMKMETAKKEIIIWREMKTITMPTLPRKADTPLNTKRVMQISMMPKRKKKPRSKARTKKITSKKKRMMVSG
jgi:hypothetical protein